MKHLEFSQAFEKHRPLSHYSVEKGWMNDPNGLVYFDGTYHLYHQFHPFDIKFGPMHWGHAVSKDLIKWDKMNTALFPDELGVIFSGSMVVDIKNTSGFGKDGKTPFVAVFTHHLEKNGTVTQSQSIAYSLDNGSTFTKYEGNPVITYDKGPDFRDPKVFWHEESNKWVMICVAGKHAVFYGSENLKKWTELSTFNEATGTEETIWECPDLIKIKTEDASIEKWALLYSVNAPDGSYFGMRYFVGEFDGTTFTAETKKSPVLLIDYGYDNYAAVTFNGVSDRTLLMGWMNCWHYADKVPADDFRGSMIIPRELFLRECGEEYIIVQKLCRELDNKFKLSESYKGKIIEAEVPQKPFRLKTIWNDSGALKILAGEQIFVISVDAVNGIITVDRRGCGHEELGATFYRTYTATLHEKLRSTDIDIFVDTTSVEILAGRGEQAITLQVFPDKPFDKVIISSEEVVTAAIYTIE